VRYDNSFFHHAFQRLFCASFEMIFLDMNL